MVNAITDAINKGDIVLNDQLPSINEMSLNYNIAKETVNKSYKILIQKGILRSVHGKGFFFTSTDIDTSHRLFLLFDTFTSYKEVVYSAIKDFFGKDAYLDIYFHHFNIKTFRKHIEDAVGHYTSYIILPFDHEEMNPVLKLLPRGKVFLLDRNPRMIKGNFPAVYQDYNTDIYDTLSSVSTRFSNYERVTLVFRNTITELPLEL